VAALVLRHVTTRSSPSQSKKAAGDISSVFASLSGAASVPLPSRFANLKSQLIAGNKESLRASWEDLLSNLKEETQAIKELGPAVIPELNFKDLGNVEKRTKFRDGLQKRGVAVVRGVVSEEEALGWKELVKRYIKTNPSTRGGSISSFNMCYIHPSPPAFRAQSPMPLRRNVAIKYHSRFRSSFSTFLNVDRRECRLSRQQPRRL